MFDRIFTFVVYTCFAFILITSMEDIGKIIGFDQMGILGISIVFGAVYLQLMIMNDKKKDKEEDKEKEVVLNSCYVSDYENTFGFSAESMCTFFDGYVDYLWELAKEDGFDGFDDAFEDYDNAENLWYWYNCFDDFSWVEYVNDEEEDE